MSDAYVECLVKAKGSMLLKFLQIGLIVVTAIFGFIGITFMIWPALLIAVATGVGAYFAYMNADIEYEYLYLDKEITIDKVMAKSRRKRVGVFTLERMEVLAPVKSYHLDNFKNRNVKVLDYSIGVEEQPDLRYALYYEGGVKLILSPSEEMVKVLKNVAPRKVFTD
ncbi:MAG: hypothetical protein J6L65_10830 [Lachnospiraceae bacterium]|nr:hypothetical protein [Lachnospiraceae bacterium]